MAYGVVNADKLSGSNGGSISPDSSVFRNRIINGAMVIDQRNAGAAVTASSSYPVDRFQMTNTSDGAFSAQQDSSAPSGFVNSVKVTTTTADATLATTQRLTIRHIIEGTNISDLAWGTASAKTVTMSFWVRSSLTGTFGGALQNGAGDRSYPFTYSISAADTWEQKSVTITGDTSGTWLTTTGRGILIFFGLGAGPDTSGTAGAWASAGYTSATGATSVVGTNGATFYITGVQLEKGSTATSFDYRPYGTELSLCQRYYYRLTPSAAANPLGTSFSTSTTVNLGTVNFPVTMRIVPSALEQSGTATDYSVLDGGGSAIVCSAVPTFSQANYLSGRVFFTVASGLVAGQGGNLRAATTSAYLGFSAEL